MRAPGGTTTAIVNVSGNTRSRRTPRTSRRRSTSRLTYGDLTINGTTKPIELPVEFNGIEAFQDERHAGFSAAGELRRSDYGIAFGIIAIGAARLALADIVKFELDLQFIEPTAEAGYLHGSLRVVEHEPERMPLP